MYSFPLFKPVFVPYPGYLLFLDLVSQDAGKVVWHLHCFKTFQQFVVIHTVNCFNIVNEAEVDVPLEFCFFYDPPDVGNLIPLAFLNAA